MADGSRLADLDVKLPHLPDEVSPAATNGATWPHAAAGAPDWLYRCLDDEHPVGQRSEAIFRFAAQCVEEGLDDNAAVDMVRQYRAAREKFTKERDLDTEAVRVVGKVRGSHNHPGRRCIDANCPKTPAWHRRRSRDGGTDDDWINESFGGAPSGNSAPEAGEEPPEHDSRLRFRRGGDWITTAPSTVPAVWGEGEEVLWSVGEGFILTGGPGVGKTTLTAQIVAGLVGVLSDLTGTHRLLRWPVEECWPVLLLAMDRPEQIRRAFRRLFPDDEHQQILNERLVIWPGPPTHDVARHPNTLLNLAREAKAKVVILDSLKDAAVGLSDDEVGAGLNRAIQLVLADGIEVGATHHQVKRGGEGGKPTTLGDLYGSAWIAVGAGSVVLLLGEPGAPEVELRHLKQPAVEVGPLKVIHDHTAGTSMVSAGFDVLADLRQHPGGVTVQDVAKAMFTTDHPAPGDVQKARRRLENLDNLGFVTLVEPGRRGGVAARYGLVGVAG